MTDFKKEREAIIAPRRRVEVSIKISADNWESARWAIRQIETDIVMNGGKLNPFFFKWWYQRRL